MFYAHFVLAKKGPLARIWLAAHWDKKLTKAHVFETNIEKSVDGILQPKVKMALRTSGHLLLGVVRIYSRKAKYLLADCNEAFVKIKMAFRPGMVDLPEDIREAAVSAITLPEVFHDFDTPMPELNDVDIQAQFTLNQSRAEEITMREDYGNISLVTCDNGFGDIGFEEQPLMRDNVSVDQNLDQSHSLFKDRDINLKDQDSRLANSTSGGLDMNTPIQDDGFGGNLGQDLMGADLFGNELFEETHIGEAPQLDSGQPDKIKDDDSDDDDDVGNDIFGGPASVGAPSSDGGSHPGSPRADLPPKVEDDQLPERPGEINESVGGIDQTTLLQNEEESFALAPVDSSAIKSGWPRTKRKRKLIVDEVKNISGEEMKAQLSDTTDIVTTLDLAPPSKRLMHWKETGGVEKLFALPGRSIDASCLSKRYQRNLTSQHSMNEDFGMAGDKEIDNLRLEQVREDVEELVTPRPRGRPPKRKLPESEARQDEPRPKRNQPPQAAVTNASFDDILPTSQANISEVPSLEEHSFSSPAQVPAVPTDTTPVQQSSFNDERDEFGSPRGADLDLGEPAMSHDDMMSPEPHHDMSVGFNLPANQSNEEMVPEYEMPAPSNYTADEEPHDEQADDETYEQFEERVVNKRAGQLFHTLKRNLREGSIEFSSLTVNGSRKIVAQKFYTLLVLKKLQAVELSQNGAYSEISISRGGLFENAVI